MSQTERQRAVELVRLLVTASGSEGELDAAMADLKSLVPDPSVGDIIFWPSRHELSKDLDDAELTPERIFALACQYRPFDL